MAVIKTLSIELQGEEKQVVGGDFYDMLDSVKAIPGRRWDGDRKLWVIPLSLAETSKILGEDGLTILDNDDDVIDAEIAEIERVVDLLKVNMELAQEKLADLDEWISGYSYTSKSRVKGGLMQDAGCIRGAIAALKKPIDTLAEVEIRSIRRTLKILEID